MKLTQYLKNNFSAITHQIWRQKKNGYFWAFFLPILIMLVYFIAIGAYPFGQNTIMTVDLGQQYIDFFGYFHDTILKHPTSFFYSFGKDLGGDALGIWSYYLLSPLNLLFLLVSKSHLDVAVIGVTLLKYGLMSWSFYFFSRKTTHLKTNFLLIISLSYALSGFFIANQFNLIWLDAGYLLPLVALGINDLFTKKNSNRYIFSLAAILIINYYMGYMICLFAILYFGYQASINYHTFQDLSKKIRNFIFASIAAACLAAFILLPTLFQLTQSKGTYTVKSIQPRLEYAPLKILTKFNIGAYNFDAVSQGYPNLFIPSMLLALAVLYFFSKNIAFKIRFCAFLITVFLIFSLCFEPLDLLWHGLQFPVWYPYRFSYLVIFWFLVLALEAYAQIDSYPITRLIIPGLLFISIVYSSLYYQKKISYLNFYLIVITALFFIVSLIILGGIINHYPRFNKLFPWLIGFEVIINAYVSLSRIGFISHHDYQEYLSNTEDVIQRLKRKDPDFYRIAKSFQRTNDDPMMLDYNGTDQFNSMLEPKISQLYAKLGQPQSEGDVTYGNGNLFLDALLDIKYYLDLNATSKTANNPSIFKPIGSRADVSSYGVKTKHPNVIVKENPYALALGFLVPKAVFKTELALVNPINNYNAIYQAFSWKKDAGDLFLPFHDYEEKLVNVTKKADHNWATYQKIDKQKPGKIVIKLKPQTNDPYYVSLNGNIGDQDITYQINGHPIQQNKNIHNTVVQSLFQNQQGKVNQYELQFNQKELTLYDFNFYFMASKSFLEQNNALQNQKFQVSSFRDSQIKGKIVVDRANSALFFSIPAVKGWHATVDGKSQKFQTAFGHFLALPLKRGKHEVTLNYEPPYFKIGLTISLLALMFQIGRLTLPRLFKRLKETT